MDNMLNNAGLWLSIGASFIVVISGVVSFLRFLFRQQTRSLGQMRLEETGQIYYPQPQRGLGYHFGCLLKTAIIIVLIIALATVLTYVTMAILALYIQSQQSIPYTTPYP